MTSTVGLLEPKNFLNPDLTWKKVSKANRSATRRNRKPGAKFLTAGVELADKSLRRSEETTVSDSEKLGVAVLGRRFSDKMEHVPIKKRKYTFRSPSPPLQTPTRSKVSQHASGQGSSLNSSGKRVHMSVDASTASFISPLGVDGKFSEPINGKLDFREDFSGIEMLADAACSDNFDVHVEHTVENPVTAESACRENDSVMPKEETGVSLETTNLSPKDIVESSCRENDSAMPKEETGVSLETTNLSPKDIVAEDRVEESSIQETTSTGEQKSPRLEANKMSESSVPLCNDRLHWDLNVVMDDWQQPSDIVNVETNTVEGSSKDKSETLNIQKSGETDSETGEADVVKDNEMVNKLVSSELHSDLSRQDIPLEASSFLDKKHDECGADGKLSTQVVSTEECFTNVPCPSNTAMAINTLSPVPVENKKSDLIDDKVVCVENVQVEEHDVASPYVPAALDGVTTHEVDSTALETDGEDPGRASSLQNDISAPQEVRSIENCQPSNAVSFPVEPACADCAGEEAVGSHVSLKCEDVSTSNAPLEVQDRVTGEKNPLADEAVPSHTSEIDTSVHVSEEVIHTSSGNHNATMERISEFTTQEDCNDYAPLKSLGEIDNEEPDDKICESDSAEKDKGGMIGVENSRELQAGYDSQFEDGELRETDVHCWDENEGDSAEIEQVDYESECDGERMSISETEGSENKIKFESGSTRGCGGDVTEKIEECDTGVDTRDHLTSLKMRTLEATDGSKLKRDTDDCEDGLSSKDFGSKVVGSRECRSDYLSRNEGSLSSETIQRSGSDNCDDLFSRSEREAVSKSMERDRSAVMQMRCRSPGGGDAHIVNTRHSPTYDGFYGPGRLRPRSVIETRGYMMASDRSISEATEGFENHVRRPYPSSSSNSYRQHNRRSIAYRDDINGIHAGTAPFRDGNNPDRSRFRRYPQGVGRDIREIYHRPLSNYSTDHMPPHRLARRERSISPPVGGGRLSYAQPYKKSRSRSRSRSPTSRLLLRERNEGSRRRSRSPNFRSVRMDRVSLPFQKRFAADFEEGYLSPPRKRFSPQHNSQFDDRISAVDNFRSPNFRSLRMERVRLPFQKHFAAEYEEGGFISPPRKRFSPQHNSQFDERISALDNFRSSNFRSIRTERVPRKRFSPQNNSRFDDRLSSGLDNFRERKSSPPPVRNFRQGQRFDSVRSIRPIGHPRRFPDMGGAGRGYNKYEGGDDDRRKPGSRFDMIPRMRRYEDADNGGGGMGAVQRRMVTTEDE